MSNQVALAGLFKQWRAIPDSRRPGCFGHFRMTPQEAERYILDVRGLWSRFGPAVREIADPHRIRLAENARLAITDVDVWLRRICVAVADQKLERTKAGKGLLAWSERWQAAFRQLHDNPLEQPFGMTLGSSPGSSLLESYRWWGPQEGEPLGPAGPLDTLPDCVAKAVASNTPSGQRLARLWAEELGAFPASVNELHHELAVSPWTAVYVLNWLLSDKGILPRSSRSPKFDGPMAVPHARLWLDHLTPAFNDWYAEQFATRPRADIVSTALPPPERLNSFNPHSFPWQGHAAVSNPGAGAGLQGFLDSIGPLPSNRDSHSKYEAAYDMLACPVLPAAYVVPAGSEPLTPGTGSDALSRDEGLCTVLEFLMLRVTLLETSIWIEDEAAPVPRLTIVDGTGKAPLAVIVNLQGQPRKVPQAAASLLYALGRDGIQSNVAAKAVRDLRNTIPEIQHLITCGKKCSAARHQRNYYSHCSAPALHDRVAWHASKVAPPKRSG